MTQSALERNPASYGSTLLLYHCPYKRGFTAVDSQDLAWGVGGEVSTQQSYPVNFKFVPTGLPNGQKCCRQQIFDSRMTHF